MSYCLSLKNKVAVLLSTMNRDKERDEKTGKPQIIMDYTLQQQVLTELINFATIIVFKREQSNGLWLIFTTVSILME